MSITRIATVHCDGCGDWREGDHPHDNGAQIRAQLHLRGWVARPGGVDLCPNCVSQEAINNAG